MAERRVSAPGRAMKRPGARPQSDAALTPKDIAGMLRRHVLLVVVVTILGAGVGGGTWYLLRRFWPMYHAQAFIRVLPPLQTDPMEIVPTQVQKDIQYQHRVTMASLLKSEANLRLLLRRDKVRETTWFAQRGGDIRKSVKDLKRHMSGYPHRDSEHILLGMSCGSAKEAALIANEMATLFVSSQGDTKRRDVGNKLTELEKRRTRVEGDLSQAEDALKDIRRTAGITDLETRGGRYFQHTITMRLNDLEMQESDLNLALTQLKADIANLQKLATDPVAGVQVRHAIERDPVMLNLAQQLALQEASLASRLTKFGENHRIVRQTQELIREMEEKRRERTVKIADQTRQANLMNARQSVTVLEQRLSELERLRNEALNKQQKLDEARAQYEQRLKTRDERVETRNAIIAQIEKLRIILTDPDTPKVQIAQPAIEPLEMVMSRHILLWIPAGTIMGLLSGIALAFLIEMLNDLVRTPRDVTRHLGVRLLGVIPDVDEDNLIGDADLYQAVRQAPYSVIGESYRRFRTHFELSADAESSKAILVAGGDAGDGTTSVAINLATAFVSKGEKVLLIDANFRQPSLSEVFPRAETGDMDVAPAERGLSSLLRGQCGLEEVIRPSGVEGFYLVDAGPMPANPAELLAGKRMKTLIEAQRGNFDHIVVDAPPVLLVSDATIVARVVDATILVFNAAATRRGAAQRTIFEMQDVGANVVGCVLFAAQAMKGGYFHQQFKAYRRYLKPQLAAMR